jgi:Spy/CpxP family protein refolding chaperone
MKNRERKFAGVLVLTMAVVLSASLVLAGPGGWGRGMGYGGGGPGMGMGMGMGQGGYPYAGSLTPEQSQKIQALQESFLKEITPLQNQLFTSKTELRTLWSAAKPDKEQIMAKQNEINALRQQLQERATQHQFEIRSIVGQ